MHLNLASLLSLNNWFAVKISGLGRTGSDTGLGSNTSSVGSETLLTLCPFIPGNPGMPAGPFMPWNGSGKRLMGVQGEARPAGKCPLWFRSVPCNQVTASEWGACGGSSALGAAGDSPGGQAVLALRSVRVFRIPPGERRAPCAWQIHCRQLTNWLICIFSTKNAWQCLCKPMTLKSAFPVERMGRASPTSVWT